MTIGIVKAHDDRRVVLTPKNVAQLVKLGLTVAVEAGAGKAAGFADSTYEEAGANITSRPVVIDTSQLLPSIQPIPEDEWAKLSKEAILVSQFQPYNKPAVVDTLNEHDIMAFSLDMIPRTTLAQQMDVLSSMASIAGYQAVLEGARLLPRFFPMMITAAGSIKPTKVLVLGAGVAGLQAIATAKRLGAVVEAFDVRQAAKEEVESLGGRFIEVEGATDDKAAGGYAVEQTDDFKQRQAALIQKHAREADVIIATAQLRGRPAPILVDSDTVAAMRPGSVIIDLAASTGGNCALTENDATIIKHDVTIVGDSDLAQQLPQDASTLFGNNVLKFLQMLLPEGQLSVDMDNEIISGALITTAPTTQD